MKNFICVCLVTLLLAQMSFAQNRRGNGRFIVPETTRGSFEASVDVSRGNKIDEIVFAGLKKRKMIPAPLCSDDVFIRRVYIDVLGALPKESSVRDFLASSDPNRRAILIDSLLSRDEFADYWTMKWCDVLRIKSEFPINLWPNGTMTYYRWLHDAIRTNMPYNQFAKTLLTASGSDFRDAPANFYRAVPTNDPKTLAENVALTFLGQRTGIWPSEKRDNMSVFFSRVGYKASAEWKEETVYWTRKPLDSSDVIFPDGKKGTVLPDQDPRAVFADWLVNPANEAFNTNITNRIWFWLIGRGIIHEPDDLRADNPPVYPVLIAHLNRELLAAKYDLKHIYRIILNSKVYQQSSIPAKGNPEKADNSETGEPEGDVLASDAEKYFAVYPIRRIEAEVLQDALNSIFSLQIGYTSEVPEPFTYIPARQRTILLFDSGISSSFLEMFGRSTRDSGLITDRNNSVTESQQLFFLNSSDVNNWVNRYSRSLRQKGKTQEEKVGSTIDTIWLTFLSRYPTPSEKKALLQITKETPQAEVLADVVWAVLNTKEFLCRH